MAKSPSKSASKSPAKSAAVSSDTKLVNDLAKILNEADLGEIEFEKGSLKIRISRNGGVMMASAAPAQMMAAPVAAPIATAPSVDAAAPVSPAAAAPDHKNATKSPMVGTAYVRPSPEADSFVKVGDTIKAGATVLLIEAMKTFNPITADKTGTLIAILVEDAQPVEFGEPLFVIE